MPSPEEQAYSAVERAYGQGDFTRALELALALQPQLPPGRHDQLDQRLQLLIGHIYLFGLAQPRDAEAAYQAVLASCTELNYRQLAEQSLQRCAQQPAPAEPTPTSPPAREQQTGLTNNQGEPSELPATPWLQHLQNPQQALGEIQEAWASAVPAKAAETAPLAAATEAATPWAASTSTQAEVREAIKEPIATTSFKPPLLSEAAPVLQPSEDPERNWAKPDHTTRTKPERNDAMASELDRGLLLVKLSRREGVSEAKAQDQSPEIATHQIQQEPPKAGGSWQRFKSLWLRISRQQPNGGGGYGH
jgi:hypothetical protein